MTSPIDLNSIRRDELESFLDMSLVLAADGTGIISLPILQTLLIMAQVLVIIYWIRSLSRRFDNYDNVRMTTTIHSFLFESVTWISPVL